MTPLKTSKLIRKGVRYAKAASPDERTRVGLGQVEADAQPFRRASMTVIVVTEVKGCHSGATLSIRPSLRRR